MQNMRIKKLSESAVVPTKGDEFAAGYDLYCSETCILPAWSRCLVKTDIAMEIPKGFYGRIASRSGLGVKGFDIGAGVIDSSYRGEIKVVMINATKNDSTVEQGTRCAQIVFEKHYDFEFIESDNLSETTRGEGGFASTGK
tara:strand:+ start:38 stop:460 length:423 start_codon:yes stop_codon:yes gene_type:complete